MLKNLKDPVQECLDTYLAFKKWKLKRKVKALEKKAQYYLRQNNPLNPDRFLAIELAYQCHKKALELRRSLHLDLEISFLLHHAVCYMHLMYEEG